jgi:hypothetical protein
MTHTELDKMNQSRTACIKPIAIVLPQFHPIPENDKWWGPGFTEWNNVVKATPLFRSHYQPHLPADLGFYDLRLKETQIAQAEMARTYGIYGFCYYHYWFNGKRLLETPVNNMLSSKCPNFPFMLCWANENWARTWDGSEKKTLMKQEYSPDDFRNHAKHLVQYFRDPRYIRIANKPVFAVYNSRVIPDLEVNLLIFREELGKHGIEIFLCSVESFFGGAIGVGKANNYDGAIEFQPHTTHLAEHILYRGEKPRPLLGRSGQLSRLMTRFSMRNRTPDTVVTYSQVVENDIHMRSPPKEPVFPGICPGWDNSARRRHGGAFIVTDSTPETFHKWAKHKVCSTDWETLPDQFLFVNAWNEWAEGNHLEPCQKWGRSYLEALNTAVTGHLQLR